MSLSVPETSCLDVWCYCAAVWIFKSNFLAFHFWLKQKLKCDIFTCVLKKLFRKKGRNISLLSSTCFVSNDHRLIVSYQAPWRVNASYHQLSFSPIHPVVVFLSPDVSETPRLRVCSDQQERRVPAHASGSGAGYRDCDRCQEQRRGQSTAHQHLCWN